MASFFKFSCTIYWIGWVYYTGYLLGLQFYVQTYILKTTAVQNAETYILALCLYNILISFVGCAYVKCNIVHIYCSCCFLVPLLVVNITLSTMAILACGEAAKTFPGLDAFIQTHHSDPNWLQVVEQTAECCGYWGYWDHASILPPTGSRHINLSSFIPSQCCQNSRSGCPASIDTPLAYRLNVSQALSVLEIALTSDCPLPEDLKNLLVRRYNTTNSLVFYISDAIDTMLHKCGCHLVLLNAHTTIYGTAHFIFIIVNACIVFLMMVVYIRNWCLFRFKEGSSDHSLDEDTFSELSLMESQEQEDEDRKSISDIELQKPGKPPRRVSIIPRMPEAGETPPQREE